MAKKNWSAKQIKAIELLAIAEQNHDDICISVGINKTTLTRWKRKPGFMEEVLRRARKKLKEDVPEVYRALSNHSKAGNSKHINIYLNHLEKLEQIRASRANLTFTWLPITEVEHD